MKNTLKNVRAWPFVIAAVLAVSCKSPPETPPGANDPAPDKAAESAVKNSPPVPGFGEITGKEWKLVEVRSSADSAAPRFNRRELAEAGMENAYTLRFDGERLSGLGAPNRYSAPYTRGAGQTLSIGAIAATLMASFMEPENLKEREYFGCLENVEKWDLIQGQLRLISRNGRGEETILIFETG